MAESFMSSAPISDRDITRRTIKGIGVGSASAYGAFLTGLLWLIQGIIALIVTLFRTDAFAGWQHAVLFAGVGLGGLVIGVLMGIVVGGVTGAVAALVYNLVARYTGGIQIDLE
ncbi:MAG: hypothetical protein OJF49_000686 [Ktedonobacterales bacterium]|jgi:hypothetical protein|nr:MAG: hypothetical protein OJF49_000686 [Ktedonobacterales bacterium]